MKQKKWIKSLAVIFTLILMLGQISVDGLNVSAAPRKALNVKAVTLSVGKSKQLKVSGVKAGKVKWTSSKKQWQVLAQMAK